MLSRAFAGFDIALKATVGVIVFALAVIGFMQVFFRYVVGSSLSWTEEMGRFLLIWLVLIAAAAEVERGTHIAVKILVNLFPEPVERWIERFNMILVLIVALVMVVYGLRLSANTMMQQATTLPIMMGQVYLAVPISGAIMALNAFRVLLSGSNQSNTKNSPGFE